MLLQLWQLMGQGRLASDELSYCDQHLAWLLEAMRCTVLQLGGDDKYAGPSSPCLAPLATLAADIIKQQQQQQQQQQQTVRSPYAAVPTCVPAALALLAQTGHELAPGTIAVLLPALERLAAQPACVLHVAAVCGILGGVQPPPQVGGALLVLAAWHRCTPHLGFIRG